ncbi:MAG: SDR family oxidoreductase [Alphaproteobacteria bacterium]|nr:SDR family oxidoreductase [Alphaproteobacteria bacterium]
MGQPPDDASGPALRRHARRAGHAPHHHRRRRADDRAGRLSAPGVRLDGKRAIVTGAGGGIGRALVTAFAQAGARVIGCDRTATAMADLDLAGREVFDLGGDDLVAVARRICAAHGAPDILVNNAGYSRGETLDTTTDAQIAEEIGINLTATVRLTHALLPEMATRGGGAIVFVSSVNGLAHFGNPAYSAAKAGLQAYCRAVAVEAARHGIRANAVCPGSVRTPAWDHRIAQDPGVVARTTQFYPMGRLVEPAEVAQAVLFLASPLASGITGVALPVDAGLTAGNIAFIDTVLGR